MTLNNSVNNSCVKNLPTLYISHMISLYYTVHKISSSVLYHTVTQCKYDIPVCYLIDMVQLVLPGTLFQYSGSPLGLFLLTFHN